MELNWPSLLKNSSVQKIKMLWKHLSPNKVQLLLLLTLDRIVSVCNMACPTASNMQNIAKTRSREEGGKVMWQNQSSLLINIFLTYNQLFRLPSDME